MKSITILSYDTAHKKRLEIFPFAIEFLSIGHFHFPDNRAHVHLGKSECVGGERPIIMNKRTRLTFQMK